MAGLILAWVKPLCGPQEWSLKKGLWMCVYVCERVWANEGACRPEFVSDYTKCISFFLTSCINVSLKTLCHCQSKGTRNLCCSDDSTVGRVCVFIHIRAQCYDFNTVQSDVCSQDTPYLIYMLMCAEVVRKAYIASVDYTQQQEHLTTSLSTLHIQVLFIHSILPLAKRFQESFQNMLGMLTWVSEEFQLALLTAILTQHN